MQGIDDIRVMVYLMTGFLESGKTQFLRYTLSQDYFRIQGNTLLITCEQGIEEYDEAFLKRTNTFLENVDSVEELTEEWFLSMEKKYNPERVMIECNGMIPVTQMEELDYPDGWGMVQKLTTVDASTFQMYLANMKSLFMEMVRGADLVIFNRCKRDMPLASFRRSVKVVNGRAEIIFEDEKGMIENIFEEKMPYDLNAPVVSIEPEDFGIWYMDAMDRPELYNGKTVEITACALKPRGLAAKEFIAGRKAMTCCADDISFIGYLCRSPYAPKLGHGQWVKVKAKIGYEYVQAYGRKGPVLKAEFVEAAEAPAEELVYFN